ncbi:NlpC/P60 family protein [Lonepinella sp. MS14435]|uniref:NlpC/P60 family protein n=1 Tax=Lonepinella sp. MS14435 TaxID=3003618 RepID=UPI0036DB9DF3
MLKKILIIVSALILAACSNTSGTLRKHTSITEQQDDMQLTILGNDLKTNNSVAYKQLTQVYNKWVGTRYRMGGTGRNGIDCSAFMQETFATAFGMDLPRSTSEQKYVGKRIQKNELKQGDLVFFRKNRHVGVYMGNGRFMHSSSSQGVTISSLSEDYWARTYTQSRRVL